nr:UDP-N-acetylmuramoyl-tripeptide--D-alanyl-D-alanine ligase [Heliophilum fasciatum]
MTLDQVAAACGGTYHGDEQLRQATITGVTIDSRNVEAGFLFIPIKGKIFDGHNFIASAIEKKALCCLSEKEIPGASHPYIRVNDCFQALKDLASYYRGLFDIKVVGITGSVGKTTTKEMIASVLSEKYQVLKTQGNYNNEIGVPLTLFRLRDHHEVAVIEMGVSDFGEMRNLSRIVRPDVCVITNIGFSHLEKLGNPEGVLQAKSEIFEHMAEEGAIFLNGDDPLLRSIQTANAITPYYYGFEHTNDFYADNIVNMGVKGINCDICFAGGKANITIPSFGRQMITNALSAFAVGYRFELTPLRIKKGIEGFTPANNRFNVIETEYMTIIDDCYNANPTSMKAAIDALDDLVGRKVCILGDMKELGEESLKLHEEVGRHVADHHVDLLICAGPMAKSIAQGAVEANPPCTVLYFPELEAMKKVLPSVINKNDVVLVKASRSMKFDGIIEELRLLSE